MDYWRSTAGAVSFANSKDMLAVFNSGNTHVLKVYRCYQFNVTAAVTGVITTMQIRRLIAASGGTKVFPCSHNRGVNFLDTSIFSGTNQTVTGSDIFRRYLWTNEEASSTSNDWDNWELLVPFAEVWAAGANDTTIQPLTSRQNQGIEIFHSGSSAVGSSDLEIEFSVEEL